MYASLYRLYFSFQVMQIVTKLHVCIVVLYFLNKFAISHESQLSSISSVFTDYQFWYPPWEVPRPLVCDPLCIFTIFLRGACFVLCVIVVLIIQSRFPDIYSEKQMLSESKKFSTEEEMKSAEEESETEGASEEEEDES